MYYDIFDKNAKPCVSCKHFYAKVCGRYRDVATEERLAASTSRALEGACSAAGKGWELALAPDPEAAKIGDTIVFMTDEDFAKDDENLACTAGFRTFGSGDDESDCWGVYIADAWSVNARPVIDENRAGATIMPCGSTKDELIAYMACFGMKPV